MASWNLHNNAYDVFAYVNMSHKLAAVQVLTDVP